MTTASNVVSLRRAAPDADPARILLQVRGLSASFRRPGLPPVRVLNEIDLEIRAGETLGIIGESASGKSTLALNVLRLIDERDLVIDSGEILWRGVDLLKLGRPAMQRLRGAEISMVFQDPMTALDPLVPVHRQIAEVILAHRKIEAAAAEREALQLLERVGLSRQAAMRRPFELSGGQRQRTLISMAVANKPQLIIADEPTTALDATVQAEVLELLKTLSREVGAAVLLITHDLGVIAKMSDRVMVMYSGQIVESAAVDTLFSRPRMPYTWSLLRSAPKTFEGPRIIARAIPGTPPTLDKPPSGCRFHPRCEHAQPVCGAAMPGLRTITPAHSARCHFADLPEWRIPKAAHATAEQGASTDDAVLELKAIRKVFGSGSKTVVAVDDIDLMLRRSEVLAIVGESGCGKTTLGKMIVRLLEPSGGTMRLCGEEIESKNGAQLRAYRRRVQMVFQDPYSSLNPRMRILDAVAEPLRMAGTPRAAAVSRAAELLERCGLPAPLHRRFPHQFSGGQRQRVGIARALILNPEVVVLDEPVSALDVSIQAQILDLLREMRRETSTSFIFISHDLSVVRQLSDRTAVMLGGKFVELAPTDELFARPQHDYTRKLLAAARVDISARDSFLTSSSSKRALIIGSGGPTGPLIVNGLLARGYAVSVLSTGRHPVQFDGEVERIIADPHFLEPLEAAMKGRSFDVAVAQYGRLRLVAQALTGHAEHLIGIGGVFYPGWIDPAATVRPTSETGEQRDWTVPYLDEAMPMSESRPLESVGKMGQRVVETDAALRLGHERGDYIVTLLRYPRVYGPRQPGAAEWSIIRRILDGRRRILVPNDGFHTNSVLYVENAARIVLSAIEHRDAASGQIFNCADVEPITHRKWIKSIAAVMGADVELVSAPMAMAKPAWPYARFPQSAGHHILDTSKLASLSLGELTPFDIAIRRTVEWYIEDPDRRGRVVEPQLRDPFRYDVEDRLFGELDELRRRVDAIEMPQFDMAHTYAHPKEAKGAADGG